jgi:hypothetical protein
MPAICRLPPAGRLCGRRTAAIPLCRMGNILWLCVTCETPGMPGRLVLHRRARLLFNITLLFLLLPYTSTLPGVAGQTRKTR